MRRSTRSAIIRGCRSSQPSPGSPLCNSTRLPTPRSEHPVSPARPARPPVFIDFTASEVTVVTPDGARVNASRNLLLCPGDEVQTGATGRVAIRFDQKRTVIRLDGNSRTRVLSGGTGDGDVSLISGILYFVSSVRRHFEVDTPYIVAGIDGTEAIVAVRPPDRLAMAVVREGLVSAYDRQAPQAGVLKVAGGEAAFRSANVPFQSAPIGALPAPFRDLLIASDAAVDWAIYYPPISRVSAGFPAFLRTNVVRTAGGINPTLSGTTQGYPNAAATPGTTPAPLTEDTFNLIISKCWQAGAEPTFALVDG